MKNSFLTLSLLALVTIGLQSQDVWKLDKTHSKFTFTVVHLGLAEVDGVFKEYEATITTTESDFSDAVIVASADLTTVDTNNGGRNAHLQRDDMFDTANHPTLKFMSTGIEKVDDKNFRVTGDLTIKGTTKSVDLNLRLIGTGKNPRSQKDLAGFKMTGTINRTDFGVGGMPSMMVSHEVELSASGEFIKQ